jgi:hypothetical protein
MADRIDIDGKDYALILSARRNPVYIKDPDENYKLLGNMENTPYGDMRVYYTGIDPRLRALTSVRYQFFDQWRGHVSQDQVLAAQQVWSADAVGLSTGIQAADVKLGPESSDNSSGARGLWLQQSVDLCSLELKPNTAYEVIADTCSVGAVWRLVVLDTVTGRLSNQLSSAERETTKGFQGLFRTFATGRVRITARESKEGPRAPLCITRVTIREVGELTF